MEPVDPRIDPDPGLVGMAFMAWFIVAVGGTLALVFADGAILLAVWAALAFGSVCLIVGGSVVALREDLPTAEEVRAIIRDWRRRHGHSPEPDQPTDVPFSDDEYTEMRKKVPFIGIVRSQHTDTSEIMNGSSTPIPDTPLAASSVVAVAAALAASARPAEHRQKA